MDKGGYFIMIKGSTHQEDITLNINAPNDRLFKYVMQKLVELNRKTDKSTTVIRDFNTSLSLIDRVDSQKTSKDI